jgi:hypothetical protein
MKLLVITNDPVRGTELADILEHGGHLVVRAWSAGEALLLLRNDPPMLAIIDRCYGDVPEAPRLADYLLDKRIDMLWLGEPPPLLPKSSNALVAALAPPCDPGRVNLALEVIAHTRAGAEMPARPVGLAYLTPAPSTGPAIIS